MKAVFLKDVKAFFNSPIAYVVIGLFMFLGGIPFINILYYASQNNQYSSNMFASIISFMSVVFIFIVPIITMRSFTEERKNLTEVLLYTSPQKNSSIVFGKFFALVFEFSVIVFVSFLFPALLFIFTKPYVPTILAGYLGLFLLGVACLSIGMFVSSFTENQIVSAIISFVVMLGLWLMNSVKDMASGSLSKVLDYFAITSKFDDFAAGIINVSHIIFLLSIAVVFNVLTILFIEKRRWSEG